MMSSSQYYDKMAASYETLMDQRNTFLLAVESLIFELSSGKSVNNYLDVGCGNGIRSMRIMEGLKPEHSLLIDESKEMIQAASFLRNEKVQVEKCDFLEMKSNAPFQIITCLWNVFGHLESKSLRLAFLKQMHSLLDQNGLLFIDINNRYNVNQYGWPNVMRNMLRDILRLKDSGKFALQKEGDISNVYVHNPFEFDKLITEAGFSRLRKIYIDYRTGHAVKSFIRGQTVYCIEK